MTGRRSDVSIPDRVASRREFFKLLAAIGAWLGWQALPTAALLAAASGLIFALCGILLQRRDRRQPMPFGPFLAAAGWLALLFRDPLNAPLGL